MATHLLVVDDDRILVDALREVLVRRFTDARVETCTSAERSLERIEADDFDTIISDVRMPGTDGLTLLERAHKLRPNTPIVLITGLGDYDLAVRALRGGAFDFITKPVDTDYLAASVLRALRVREIARQLEAQKRALADHAEELAHIVEEQTRELREANRMKDEFLATLSHELRTPLTSILGWSRLLLRGELDSETQREALRSIERNAAHQARLVEDLLDVSRIMTGKMRLMSAQVQLGHVVSLAVDTIAPMLHSRNVTLERDIALSDVQVYGDTDRLQQVATNLVSNAAKFTPEGGHIAVRLRREHAHVVLTVEDDGVGIPSDFLPTVFERFRQADGSLSRSRAGLGLGLAIVKHLVELHAGSVECSSLGEGRGATFVVRLPASDAEAVAPEAGTVSNENLRGLHVLVVEDDADARALLCFALQTCGAIVVGVNGTSAALAEMDRAVPDAILCDISMPDEDGYAFIRRMRMRSVDAGGAVPAAAVTAYARPEDVRCALKQGFDAHLAKPVEPREITALVARLMTLRQGTNSTV